MASQPISAAAQGHGHVNGNDGMAIAVEKQWVVCKFGGTSVSSKGTWDVIVGHVQRLVQQGFKVCVVVSAVSQMTNHLVKVVDSLEAETGRDPLHSTQGRARARGRKMLAAGAAEAAAESQSQSQSPSPSQSQKKRDSASRAVAEAMQAIRARYERHCAELGVDVGLVAPFLTQLEQLVEGMRLTGEASSPRLRARVLSFGELMSSTVGEHVLRRGLADAGAAVALLDARDVLIASSGTGGAGGLEADATATAAAAAAATTASPRNPDDVYLNADVMPFTLDLAAFAASAASAASAAASASKAAAAGAAAGDGDADASSVGAGSFASFGGPQLQQAQQAQQAALFNGHDVVITQGFIASTKDGVTCVLGRGGSDTSGALFAALLSAARLEIWTDVDGMFSSDPRHVPGARLIEELSYREAQELAAMGAKVLHPRCLGPAYWAEIPVEIHNTMKTDQRQLTTIKAPELIGGAERSAVMAIAKRSGQVLLTISTIDMWGASGFLSRVFAPFERFGISVDLIATSQYAVSMTLDYIPGGTHGEAFADLIQALSGQAQVEVQTDCTVVSIVGRKLRQELHLMADAFKELERYDLLLLSESTEDLNMSFVLGGGGLAGEDDMQDLVRKLHHVLLERPRLVGGEGGEAGAASSSNAGASAGASAGAEAAVAGAVAKAVPGAPSSVLSAAAAVGGSLPAAAGLSAPVSPGLGPVSASALASLRGAKLRGSSVTSMTGVMQSQLAAHGVLGSKLSQLGLLDPGAWLDAELARHERSGSRTPFAIVDLASLTLAQAQGRLSVFSLAWSEEPAVLRAVHERDGALVFLCRRRAQVLHLCSVLGTDVVVKMLCGPSPPGLSPSPSPPGPSPSPPGPSPSPSPSSNPAFASPGPGPTPDTPSTAPTPAKNASHTSGWGFPAGVRVETRPISEEAVLEASAALGSARVLVTSVVGAHKDALEIDAWFKTRAGQRVDILPQSHMPAHVRCVRALQVDQDVRDTLLVLGERDAEVDCEIDFAEAGGAARAEAQLPRRVLLLGVSSTPYSVESRRPVAEHVRFS